MECTSDDLRNRGVRIVEANQEQGLPEQPPIHPVNVNPNGEVMAVGA